MTNPRGKVESPKGFQVRPWAGPRWSNQRFEHRAFGEARRPPHVQSFLAGGAQYQIFDLTLGSRPMADPEAQRASGLVYVRNAFKVTLPRMGKVIPAKGRDGTSQIEDLRRATSGSKRLRLQGGNPFGIPGLAKGQTATARIEDSRRGTGRKMNPCQSENSCTQCANFRSFPLVEKPGFFNDLRAAEPGNRLRRSGAVICV